MNDRNLAAKTSNHLGTAIQPPTVDTVTWARRLAWNASNCTRTTLACIGPTLLLGSGNRVPALSVISGRTEHRRSSSDEVVDVPLA